MDKLLKKAQNGLSRLEKRKGKQAEPRGPPPRAFTTFDEIERDRLQKDALQSEQGQITALQGAQKADRDAKQRKTGQPRRGGSSTEYTPPPPPPPPPPQHPEYPPSLNIGVPNAGVPRRPVERPTDRTNHPLNPRSQWNNDPQSHLNDASGNRRIAELDTPMHSGLSMISSNVSGSTTSASSPLKTPSNYTAYSQSLRPALPHHGSSSFSTPSRIVSKPDTRATIARPVAELSAVKSMRKASAENKVHGSRGTTPDIRNGAGERGNGADGNAGNPMVESNKQSSNKDDGSPQPPDDLSDQRGSLEEKDLTKQFHELIKDYRGQDEESDAESTRAVANGGEVNYEVIEGRKSSNERDTGNRKEDSDSEKDDPLPIQGAKTSPSKLRKPNPAAPPPLSTTTAAKAAPPSPPATATATASARATHHKSDEEKVFEMKIELLILKSNCSEVIPKDGEGPRDAEALVKKLVKEYTHLREEYTHLRDGLKPFHVKVKENDRLRKEKSALENDLRRYEKELQDKKGKIEAKEAENMDLNARILTMENGISAEVAKVRKEMSEADERHKRVVAEYQEKLDSEDQKFKDSWKSQQERHAQDIQKIEEDNNAEVQRLAGKYNAEIQRHLRIHSQELEVHKAECTSTIDALRQQLRREQESIARERSVMSQKWSDREIEHQTRLTEKDEEHAREMEEKDAEHRKLEADLRREITEKHDAWESFHDQEKSQWQETEKEWEDIVATQKLGHKEELTRIESKHAQELADIGTKHAKEIKDMDTKHAQQIAIIEAKHKKEKIALDSKISEQAREYDRFKRTAAEEAAKMLRDAEARHKLETTELEEAHEARLKEERKGNQRLKRALVDKRDQVKGLTDTQIEGLLQVLEIQIIDFYKMIKWDAAKQTRWPLPDHALQGFVSNDGHAGAKRLKQHIVLNCVWVQLYDNVFCSPFQIFGEMGDKMHHQWTEEFEKDPFSRDCPDWPQASAESEKMRYETVKQWREALKQSNPTGTNKRRKECYQQSVNDTVEDISESIDRVSSMDKREREHLRNVVEKAADIWLQICSERYRVIVVLPNVDGDILNKDWKKAGPKLRLIARPEMRRYGNAQGQALEKEEVIGVWKGSENVWSGP